VANRKLLTTNEGQSTGAFGLVEWSLFVFISVTWGATFLFIDVALESLEPGVIATMRVGLGALTLWLLPLPRSRIDREDWPRVLVLAVIWLAIPMTLFPVAQQWINSSVTGMLNGFVPSLTALLASALLRRTPGVPQLIGIGVGFVGVALISAPSITDGDTGWMGVAAVLAAAVLYAFSANMVAPLQQKYGSIPVVSRVLAASVPLTLPYAAIGVGESSLTWEVVAAMLALGVLGTGFAFVAYGTLIGRAGATRATGVTYIIPVVAVYLGVQFRGDSVAALAYIGCALVVLGTAFVSRQGR